MGENSSSECSDKQEDRRSSPAVALHVVRREQILVGKQVAVNARENNAGQRVVLERSASDGLAAALECDKGYRQEDSPVGRVGVVVGRGDGHDDGGRNGQEHLRNERSAQNPAALRGEEAVKSCEQERSEAERQQGDARTPETG